MSEEPVLLAEHDGDGLVVLTLNRPRARNSLVWDTWTALAAALDRVADDESARCLVISGGEFFSAGGDLKSTPAHGSGALAPAARLELAQSVFGRLRALPLPVIAAVEGGAIGIGWSLVLSCDLVVAARDAFFWAPFVARGIMPDGGAAWYLVERLGRHRAAELLFGGARLPAPDAAALGLVTTLAESGQALAGARQQATALAAADAGAVELTKRLLHRAESARWEDYTPLELSTAVVAQQRGSASAGRTGFP